MTLLLIGSQAAKYHFKDFRVPNDIDLIASSKEDTSDWNQYLNKEIPNKNRYILPAPPKSKVKQLVVEVEYAEGLPSSLDLVDLNKDSIVKNMNSINKKVTIASPESLLLIKRSHIIFDINWEKSIQDHNFLVKKIGLNSLSDNLIKIMNKRMDEIADRRKVRVPNFQVTNEQFFRDNVQRIIPHDQIHELIKFYDRPVFESIKKDLNMAEVDWDMFLNLPLDKQIANMAEEILVLLFERIIIPMSIKRDLLTHVIDYKRVFFKLMKGMCTNYLPFDFRLFAVDHFQEVIAKAEEQYHKVLPLVMNFLENNSNLHGEQIDDFTEN